MYDKKLAADLNSALTRPQIMARAQAELQRVRGEMYELSKGVYQRQYPFTRFPDQPDGPLIPA